MLWLMNVLVVAVKVTPDEMNSTAFMLTSMKSILKDSDGAVEPGFPKQ